MQLVPMEVWLWVRIKRVKIEGRIKIEDIWVESILAIFKELYIKRS